MQTRKHYPQALMPAALIPNAKQDTARHPQLEDLQEALLTSFTAMMVIVRR